MVQQDTIYGMQIFEELEQGLLDCSLCIDCQMKILSFGSTILKLTPKLRKGDSLSEHFRWDNIVVDGELSGIQKINLKSTEKDLSLIGNQQKLSDGRIIFLLCPDFRSLSDINDLGINLNDFPHYLPIQQLAFLRDSLKLSQVESHSLIEQLAISTEDVLRKNSELELALSTGDFVVVKMDNRLGTIIFRAPNKILSIYGIGDDEPIPYDDFIEIVCDGSKQLVQKYFQDIRDNQVSEVSFQFQLGTSEPHWWQIEIKKFGENSLIGILYSTEYRKENEYRLLLAEEKNRNQFSVQVHDKLCTKLVAIRMILDHQPIESIKELLDQVIYDSRRIMNAIDIKFFGGMTSLEAFRAYCKNMSRMQVGEIEFDWNGPSDIFPISDGYHIFRLFQEVMFRSVGPLTTHSAVSISNGPQIIVEISGDLNPDEDIEELSNIPLSSRIPMHEASIAVDVSRDMKKVKLIFNSY